MKKKLLYQYLQLNILLKVKIHIEVLVQGYIKRKQYIIHIDKIFGKEKLEIVNHKTYYLTGIKNILQIEYLKIQIKNNRIKKNKKK